MCGHAINYNTKEGLVFWSIDLYVSLTLRDRNFYSSADAVRLKMKILMSLNSGQIVEVFSVPYGTEEV